MNDRLRPRIENGDRAITLNKSLAWTILVGIIGCGFWFGAVFREVQDALEKSEVLVQKFENNALRIRSLELSGAQQETKLASIEKALESVKRYQSETNKLLRGIQKGGGI